jgi:hypothetical protein
VPRYGNNIKLENFASHVHVFKERKIQQVILHLFSVKEIKSSLMLHLPRTCLALGFSKSKRVALGSKLGKKIVFGAMILVFD